VSRAKLQFSRLLVNSGYSQETVDALWNCYDFSEKKESSLAIKLYIFYYTQIKTLFYLPKIKEYYLYSKKVKDNLCN
jgi:hypothetical protein